MTNPIDLHGLPDHDLLVMAVTQLNDLNTRTVTIHERTMALSARLLTLEIEHKNRIEQGLECRPAQGGLYSRKAVGTAAALSGGGAVLITLVIEKLIEMLLT